jgi:hypothetical protein
MEAGKKFSDPLRGALGQKRRSEVEAPLPIELTEVLTKLAPTKSVVWDALGRHAGLLVYRHF